MCLRPQQVLDAMGVPHENEYPWASSVRRIDIAILSRPSGARLERRIALEVDGPAHFTVNTLQPTGPTLVRNWLLEREGWRVVSLPAHRWDAAAAGKDAGEAAAGQRRLLQELLAEAGYEF